MKQTTIVCDHCGTDLTQTGRRPAFRLVLSCEAIPHNTSIIHASLVHPELEYTHHFCDLSCLRDWSLQQ